MKLEIDLSFKSNKWPKQAILNMKDLFIQAALEAIKTIKASKLCKTLSLSLIFVSDKKIKQYNAQFRGKNSATNVLSFPLVDFSKPSPDFLYIGEIIFSFDTIKAESKEQSKDFKNHLLHLFVHSMLHLLGYEHDLDKDRKRMERLEISILKKFGVNNPYV